MMHQCVCAVEISMTVSEKADLGDALCHKL